MGVLDDKFNAQVCIDTPSGCWNWTGTRYYGYGYLRPGNGRPPVRAHRWSYQRWVGPIPAGLELDHLCRNKACVNPAHLEPVTHRENLRRSPIASGARTACPQGHPYDAVNTLRKRGRSGPARVCRTCHANAERARREAKRQGGGLSGSSSS